jgi:Transposase and inactivated derivatives
VQIGKHAALLPVNRACQILKVSRSGYYEWVRHDSSAKRLRNQVLGQHVKEVFMQSRGIYGARRIQRELRKRNIFLGLRRISRLMTMNGLISAAHRRKRTITTNSKHNLHIADNLLARAFKQEKPNRCWVTDTTYISTKEGWLYLTILIDLYSRRVVGWACRNTIDAALAVEALKNALRERKPEPGLIVHSDRGSQFASHLFQNALHAAGAVSSMSNKGDCYDNACAESFFHTLKVEQVYRDGIYPFMTVARSQISRYLLFYNRTRAHSYLDYLSPVDFEKRSNLKNLFDLAS